LRDSVPDIGNHLSIGVGTLQETAISAKGFGPHNLAILRHMAMNAMQKEGSKVSLRGKIKLAGWNDAFLAKLLAQILKCDCPA